MASGERFGYEWEKFHEMLPEYETQFRGWTVPLGPSDFAGKAVLDVGCGMGRNLYWPMRDGAARGVGIDVDDRTLASATRTLASFPHVEVRKCSAYDLKDEGVFDVAFSIGVIHHLERPREAITNMVRAVKPGGRVLVWVYGYEGYAFLSRVVNAFRAVLVPLPPVVSNVVSYFLAAPLWLWLHVMPQKEGYWKLASTFRFSHLRSIVLDQLLPKVANYWTREEALALFDGMGLKDIQISRVNGLSWTVVGTKV